MRHIQTNLRVSASAVCASAVLIFSPLLTAGAHAQTNPPSGGAAVSASDQKFVDTAAQAGATEIDAAKLALKRSKDDAVKSFARRMIVDHTQLAMQLKAAAPKGTMPSKSKPDPAAMQALQGLRGQAFDDVYIPKIAVAGHEQAVALFRDEADNGSNANLKQAAQKALPTIEDHLKMARDLAAGRPAIQ